MAIEKDKHLILNRIKSHYKFKSDAQLGRFLGVASNTLANWRKRNSIDLELILTKCEELNASWLCSGQGMPTNEYPNIEENPVSVIEEAFEKISSAKDAEIARLLQLLASHEATIAAQATAMEVMKRLLNVQGKG